MPMWAGAADNVRTPSQGLKFSTIQPVSVIYHNRQITCTPIREAVSEKSDFHSLSLMY